jgi:hypothetical protein
VLLGAKVQIGVKKNARTCHFFVDNLARDSYNRSINNSGTAAGETTMTAKKTIIRKAVLCNVTRTPWAWVDCEANTRTVFVCQQVLRHPLGDATYGGKTMRVSSDRRVIARLEEKDWDAPLLRREEMAYGPVFVTSND